MRPVLTIVLLLAISNCYGHTIIAGKGKPVSSLGHAVQLAQSGDTILLYPGTYAEGNIIINKSICLLGVGYPVLDGQGKFEILTLSGKDITVRGIRFENAGYSALNDFAALKVIDASRVVVTDNIFKNSFFAIHFSNSSYCAVRNNKITGNNKSELLSGNGIHLWKCNHMMVERNFITGHRDGIYFEFVTESTIYRNDSEKNVRYGLHFMFSHSNTYLYNTFRNNGAGVAVMYTKHVRMENNIFEENWGSSAYGILLKDITDSYIHNNVFVQNTTAIHMEGSSRIWISQNEFRSNGWAIKVQASCDDNRFYSNNFFSNSFDIGTNGTMTLNKFSGNYWDKYEGYDLDHNGTGDVPFHPVSLYSMIVEQQPTTLILYRSFMVTLLDKTEKAVPSLTPEHLVDDRPRIKPNKL